MSQNSSKQVYGTCLGRFFRDELTFPQGRVRLPRPLIASIRMPPRSVQGSVGSFDTLAHWMDTITRQVLETFFFALIKAI